MNLEVNQIIEGTVSGIKQYGIFFKLPENNVGFCHISKIANSFVNNILALYNIGDIVKVKVINIKDNGQIDLSIKDVADNVHQKHQNVTYSKSNNNYNKFTQLVKKNEPETFEDMLQAFMKNSDSKLKDIESRNNKRKH